LARVSGFDRDDLLVRDVPLRVRVWAGFVEPRRRPDYQSASMS
jgi:hypothetical protein